MVFLKHILLIRVVITFVIFYWKVNGDCMESLKIDGFDKRTGFQNLASKVANLEVDDQDTDLNVPIEHKLLVEKAIEDYDILTKHLNSYGMSYGLHLTRLVKRPEQMQPPETWCKIFACFEEYLKSDTPFDKYISYASIKINKYYPNFHFCYIKTCHDTLVKPKDNISITGFQDLFMKTYRTHKSRFFIQAPLTWCTIQACYNSLLEKGFDNVPAKLNRSSVPVLSLADRNTYVAEFSRFIDPTIVTKKRHFIPSLLVKKKKDTSVPVNFFSSSYLSYLYDLYEYPINWCAVKICHDDLINAGFTFKSFQENYDFLPKIKQALENNIGKRIIEIVDKVIDQLFGNTIEYYTTEYIDKYIGKLGKIIGNYLGKYTMRVAVYLMNNFLGEFLGIKVKQYLIKKCENEEPSLYIQLLFEIEKTLLFDERYKIYQSEFVPKYCFHLEKLVHETSGDTNENYIPADREKRTPFDWCMFTVVHETLQL